MPHDVISYLEVGYVNEKEVSTKNEKSLLLTQKSDGDDDGDDGIYETYNFSNGRKGDEVYETPYSETQYATPYQNNEHEYAEYSKSKNKVTVIF